MSEATADATILPEPSSSRKIAKILGWSALFLGLLIFFTAIKIPSEKIKGYIQHEISNALAAQGMGFMADRGRFTVGLGIGYRFEGVTLTPHPPASPILLDSLEAQPALIKLMTGKVGGSLTAEVGGGSIEISGSGPKPGGVGPTQVSFELSEIDLGKAGIFSMLGGVQGRALAKGSGEITGDMQDPKTLNGAIRLDLSKINISEQTLYGFKIPQLLISEAKVDITITDGRAMIKALQLGKPGSTDDLIANVTGDALLRSGLGNPDLQIKAQFRFSDKVKAAFTLLDALLGAGRQADGGYAYTITGPMSGPPTMQPGI